MAIDLDMAPGVAFGRWRVIDEGPRLRNGMRTARCRCECGTERAVSIYDLANGKSRSCGCTHREVLLERNANRNPSRRIHGLWLDPAYASYKAAMHRCYNPEARAYPNYGGRGIGMHESWRGNPLAFVEYVYATLGKRPPEPEGHTGRKSHWSLDRIDNDGNYEPGNLRWADASQQASNRRPGLKRRRSHA